MHQKRGFKMRSLILILFLMTGSIFASMESSHQAGQGFAEGLRSQASQELKHTDKNQVPGFKTDNLPETALINGANMSSSINTKLQKSDAGQLLTESSKQRPRYKLDVNSDPLFKGLQGQSAEEKLNIRNEPEGMQKEGFIEKTCQEGGEDIRLTCHENLNIQVSKNNESVHIQVRYPNLISRILIGSDVRPEGDGHFHFPPHLFGEYFNTHTVIVQGNLPYFKTKVCPILIAWGRINIDCNSIQSYSVDHADNTCDRMSSPFNSTPVYGWLRMNIQYQTHQITSEEWLSDCQAAERLVEEGICQYEDRQCTTGPETRVINEYSIYRDCWQYRQNYQCKMIKDECSALRSEGCHQIRSRCFDKRQDRCWIYEQTYSCPNGNLNRGKTKSPPNEVFCITGDCQATNYQANGEMLEVIARLSLLKQIQDDIRNQDWANFQIFKGTDHKCSRDCLSFKDCCGGMKGWGVSLHIAGCKNDEKQLAKMREQNLCHLVGTYCAKKVLGKCVRKKTSFCCFQSKFARFLQEQGRPQLQLGFGTAECPQCRGLTVEELSRIDFSKLDFREFFEEIMQKYQQPDRHLLPIDKIQENLENIQKGLRSRAPSAKNGVVNASKDGL